MLVSQIIKDKGADVVTVTVEETVAGAAALLRQHRIGAVVVRGGDGSVAGILSERDIVWAVAKLGDGALAQPVGDWMTRDVLFAQPGETVDALMTRMTDRRVRHLPVLAEGGLAGIVSIGDLVKHKIMEVEAEADGLKAYIVSG